MIGWVSVASTLINTLVPGWFNKYLDQYPHFSPRLREAFSQGDVIEIIKLLNDMGVSPNETLGGLQTTTGLSETVTSLRGLVQRS